MKMFIGGQWEDRDDRIPVVNPYDNSAFDTVPRASVEDVDKAIASAVRGAEVLPRERLRRRFEREKLRRILRDDRRHRPGVDGKHHSLIACLLRPRRDRAWLSRES